MRIDWTSYSAPGLHDELIGPGGGARVAGRALARYLTELGGEEIGVRQQAAELAIKAMGITFTVSRAGWVDRSLLAARHHSANHRAQGVEPHRSRPAAARRRAQPLHR